MLGKEGKGRVGTQILELHHKCQNIFVKEIETKNLARKVAYGFA